MPTLPGPSARVRKRRCAACGTTAKVLNPQRAEEGAAVMPYLCVPCARREYPDLFPKPPKQEQLADEVLTSLQMPRQLVPLDRSPR